MQIAADLHYLVNFQDSLPWKEKMFEYGDAIDDIEMLGWEVVGQSVNVSHDVDSFAWQDVETNVFLTLWKQISMRHTSDVSGAYL